MKKIRTKIFLVISGCACAAVLLLGYLSLQNSDTFLRQEAEEKLVWMARSYAERFSQELLVIEDQVDEIAAHVRTTLDVEALYQDPDYLARYEQELAEYLFLFARDRSQGTAAWCYFEPGLSETPHDVYFADGDKDGTPERQEHIPFSYYDGIPTPEDDKYWWYGPAESGALCWTNPYEWSLVDGDVIKVASCAQPVIIEGKLIAVVGTYYHFDRLSADIDQIRAYESGYATLLNEKLDFIVHPTFVTATRNNSDNLSTVLDGAFSDMAKTILDETHGLTFFGEQEERLVAFSHLSNGWVLALCPPTAEVYAGIISLQRVLLVAMVACIVIALVAAWCMGKIISRPILKISSACQRLGSGHLAERVTLDTRDETKLLADSFNQMADNLEGLNRELVQLAYYDPLTKIANKNLLERSARELLCARSVPYAYVIFDVSKFKLVNDLFGLEEGDRLLIHISEMMSAAMKEDECCARINADHFHLLLQYSDIHTLEQRLRALGEQIRTHRFMLNPDYKLSVGFGVYLIEDRHTSVSIMGDKAMLALENVKGQHSLAIHFYNEELLNLIVEEKEIENAMEGALRNGEFKLYLQPKYDIQNDRIVGAEALVRWATPDRGLLSPAMFIPVLEKNGFIGELDLYMLEQVCQFLRHRMDRGESVFPISVNQSRQYLNRAEYLSALLAVVDRYGIPHELLELEITETAFFEDQEEMVRIVKRLSDMGFLIDMDDFGSGYSSLNMLQDIMVDVLKIDRIFFRDSIHTQRGQKIVGNIISMSNDLGITVVAEGIETQEQVDFLRNTHCAIIQGYYFAKPMSCHEFEMLLQKHPH